MAVSPPDNLLTQAVGSSINLSAHFFLPEDKKFLMRLKVKDDIPFK